MLLVWGLIFGDAYKRRGLFSEFYGIVPRHNDQLQLYLLL